MKDELELLIEVKSMIESQESDKWREDHILLTSVIEDIQWDRLTSLEKNEKRKSAFSLHDRWDRSNIKNIPVRTDHLKEYPKSLLIVYDLMINLRAELSKIPETDLSMRLEALLIIENRFFDEKIFPRQHVPINYFKWIEKESLERNISLGLKKFVEAYEILWNLWPKNPYIGKDKA